MTQETNQNMNEVKNPAQQLLLSEYAKEVLPKYSELATKKQILKEWAADDQFIAKLKEEIKGIQEQMKAYIEDKESKLVGDIKALNTDIGLSCKAAAKGSEYELKDLKAYFKMRAEERVEEVVQKGVTFAKLDVELL